MKRSEMIMSLVQSMGEIDVNNPDGYNYVDLAEHLLKRIEEIGMLPPHEDSEHMYTYDCFHGGSYDEVKFEWEKG